MIGPSNTPGIAANVKALDGLKPALLRYERMVRGRAGLYVVVEPTGAKRLVHRFRVGTERHRVTLGSYPTRSLETLLADHAKQREALQRGENPAAEAQRRRQEKSNAPTVCGLAERYIDEYAKPHKRTWIEDQRILNRDVLPAWGNLRAREITRADVRSLIAKVLGRAPRGRGQQAERKRAGHNPNGARQTLAVVGKVFAWAVRQDLVPSNPARDIDRPRQSPARERVLSDVELAIVLRRLEHLEFDSRIRDALRLQLLTGARIGEVLGAEWVDIDAKASTWTVPATKSKAKIAIVRPLLVEVIALIERQPSRGISPFVFASHGGRGHIRSDSVAHAIQFALPKLREGADTVAHFGTHDLRRTVATGLAALGTPREVLERVLGHKDRSITGAHYDFFRYLDPMRVALESWAAKLRRLESVENNGADVLPFVARPAVR